MKNQQKDIIKTNEQQLIEKILDLCLYYQKEEANNSIKFIENQIKFCEIKRKHLLENKPYKFQKKKMIKFNNELEKIDNDIFNHYKEIEEELSIIYQ